MSSTNKPRQRSKRNQRLEPPPPMRVTDRDCQILAALYQYRVLTQAQIHRLIFTELNPNVVQRRLYLLYHNGYVERQFLPTLGGVMTSPILYMLDKRGGQHLLKQGYYDEIRWKTSDNQVGYEHLQHLLDTNTFRIEMVLACQKFSVSLHIWQDDTTLKQDYDRVAVAGYRQPIAVIPDGHFTIETPAGLMHFFLELDRGTMDTTRFKKKVKAYIAYRQTKLSQQRFNTVKFRVLTVTLTSRRAENLRQATAQAQGQNQFWFSVLSELTADNILTGLVWRVPHRDVPVQLIQNI